MNHIKRTALTMALFLLLAALLTACGDPIN